MVVVHFDAVTKEIVGSKHLLCRISDNVQLLLLLTAVGVLLSRVLAEGAIVEHDVGCHLILGHLIAVVDGSLGRGLVV